MVKVDRYVCGECNDFKIVVKLLADKFGVSSHGTSCLHALCHPVVRDDEGWKSTLLQYNTVPEVG